MRGALVLLPLMLAGGALLGQEGERPPIPSDLLGDEHVREEFGVNQFTTPSMGPRVGLGMLIADGFLIVQCEKVEDIEPVGRALLKYGKALGTGARMNRHTQSLFENSLSGNWEQLRRELAMTQADVEAEMVQLRDVDIAHLISLGGWLRAFDISASSVANQYSPDRSRQLTRRDIAEYYLMSLETLHPSLQEVEVLKGIREGLEKMLPMLDVPQGKALSELEVKSLSETASALATEVTSRLND